jgi:hypothetical protein
MNGLPKLQFGRSVKEQVVELLTAHISANFVSHTEAAKSLGISRQRMFSYTSGKSLPRAPILDLMQQTWGLNLLGEGAKGNHENVEGSRPQQRSLFESPITLKSEDLTVVIRRKGPRLVASVTISSDVKIA